MEAFKRRIDAGLFGVPGDRRANYVITRMGRDELEFHAADWRTALNVGLNEVQLASPAAGHVSYHVRYRMWARYALALCGLIGISFVIFFLFFDLRGYLADNPRGVSSMLLTPEQGVVFAWAMAIFWGFAWPWILIAGHKRPLHRLIQRLIADVDGEALQDSGARASGRLP
jgi:hypothetical protein